MSSLQPLLLYSHKKGPNPWKVALVLEELDMPYRTKYLEFSDLKTEPYLKLNPNGKLPVIQDPNQDVTLFESGAIIEYLIDTYDVDLKLTHSSLRDRALARSWLHLQMSAPTPACGFKVWMSRTFETDEVVPANEFLCKEIKRVLCVIDSHLGNTGGPFLLGPKVSYANLSFVPHFSMLSMFLPNYEPDMEYPRFAIWLKRLKNRPAVRKVLQMKESMTGD